MSLIIQLGNVDPHEMVDGIFVPLDGPSVTEIRIDPNVIDGVVRPGYIAGTDVGDIRAHMAAYPGAQKHLGGNELIQEVIGNWPAHSGQDPSFVNITDIGPYAAGDMADFEQFLATYWECPQGAPSDLEGMYFTEHGRKLFPPGKAP